jgi:hypothetical protein
MSKGSFFAFFSLFLFFVSMESHAQIVSFAVEPVGNQFSLKHYSGLCVHPQGGSATPGNGTPTVLDPLCNVAESRLRFVMLSNGSIMHVSSGMCLHPEGGTAMQGVRLVFWNSCSDSALKNIQGNKRLAFEYTAGGSIRHKSTGLCVHPSGGATYPASGTQLVLWSGCDENRLFFNKLWW